MRRYFYNIITGKSEVVLSFLLRPLLALFSFLFLIAVKTRYFLYKTGIFRSVKLKKPVISVGNITWGGTGKTPLTEAILNRFLEDGKRPALLTRGYGKDEDKVISQNLSGVDVLSGKNRRINALKAQENLILDVFLMDDGFQHLSIKRDVDIVTINATDPIGNGFLIPAGILREPLDSLRRADMLVITKSDLVDKERLSGIKSLIRGMASDIDIFEAIHEPLCFYTVSATQNNVSERKQALDCLNGRRVCAISGLADNDSFFITLNRLNVPVVSRLSYMDHHKYIGTDIDRIAEVVKENNIDTVVTTEKDWIKLKNMLKLPSLKEVDLLVLKIELRVKESEVFYRRLSTLLSG